jgi:hypothetical protein
MLTYFSTKTNKPIMYRRTPSSNPRAMLQAFKAGKSAAMPRKKKSNTTMYVLVGVAALVAIFWKKIKAMITPPSK